MMTTPGRRVRRPPAATVGTGLVVAALCRAHSRKPSARQRTRGFTLIELMVVVAVIAIAAGIMSLALRDPASTRLEREAVRLAALLDAARAEARASGLPVRWLPLPASDASGDQFRFVGLPASVELPTRWLAEGVQARVLDAPALQLGPEATIGPQRIVLSLERQRLVLATDGLGPFMVAETGDGAS